MREPPAFYCLPERCEEVAKARWSGIVNVVMSSCVYSAGCAVCCGRFIRNIFEYGNIMGRLVRIGLPVYMLGFGRVEIVSF